MCSSDLGIQHPVLLRRPDLTIFAAHATQVGFEAALVESGVTDVAAHVVDDDVADPTALRRLFAPDAGRGWQPQALVLHYLYEADLRARCLHANIPLPPELPVIAMGQTQGAYRLRVDQRALAAVCANLILSRLQDPQRPNLHVTLSLPVQGKTSR